MAETRLEVIYSVTSTTNTTQLFKVTGNFVKAELADGTQLPDSIFSQENKAYLFSQTGDTSVFYTLCGSTLVANEFEGLARIVGVNIPSNVTYIPDWCFSYCQNLSAVTFPDTLTGFGESAFNNTGLRSIELPSSSFTLHNTTFSSTQLERINVSATTAPVLTPTTFQFVPTGGTLVYPEGSDYSSWLSTDPYYLGYYGWSGQTPTQTGSIKFKSDRNSVSGHNFSYLGGRLELEISGCTIDPNRFEVVSCVGDFGYVATHITAYTGPYYLYGGPTTRNTGTTTQTAVLTMRFYDTDGNAYLSTTTLDHIPGSYWYPVGYPGAVEVPIIDVDATKVLVVPISNEAQDVYADVISVNANLEWLSARTSYVYPTGSMDPIPGATVSGNRISVSLPANTTGAERSFEQYFRLSGTSTLTSQGMLDAWGVRWTQASGTTPTPSGSSVQFLRRQNLSVVSYDMISGASVSDTMPPTEVAGVLWVVAVPYGSNPNIVWTLGHNDLNMSLCGNTVYGYDSDQANNIVSCRQLVIFDSTVEGYTDVAIRETTSNYNVSLRVINRLPGSTATPRVLANPSAVTFSSSGYDGEYYKIADVECNGFTPDTNSVHTDVFLTTSSTWVPWYGRPFTDFVWRDNHYVIRLGRVYENSGSSRESKKLYAFTPNTNAQIVSDSATTFLFSFGMNQESAGPTPPTPPDPPIPSGSTVDSGGTGQTVTYSGCPLVFDHSASTGTWHVLPTVTTGGTSDDWWLTYNVPANDTTSARTITYYYLRYSGASCDELVDTVSYTISQAAGSGSTPMKNITLTPTAFTVTSAATGASVAIVATDCVFSSFTITSHVGAGFVNNPTVTGDMMEFTFPANTGSLRTDTFTFQLFDTDGDSYDATVILTQAGRGSTPGDEPDPWSKPEDSGYTWYTDDNLLKILPATKTLSYDEVTGYWPVTAHSFNNVEVRASGDVVFTYELIPESDQSYNSHKFYAHTEDNLGVTQQVSTIKLVAYSGTSAYSASTVLMKNPASSGWITASPNPVNANSQESQVNVYLTLTSCQRNINKEITDNPTFDAASWVTVTRVNNTTLTFNFQANTGNQPRSTYYYAYGLDAGGNNVYCRIDITQEANSMGITIIPDRTSLGKEAGSFTARVESTESGNFSFTTSPWMSVTSYVPSTSKSGTLYIDYSENLSNWPRTGVITATQQLSASPYTLSASTQISQSNTADTGYIRITPSTISVSRAAGVVEAEVSYGGLATYPQIVDDGGNMSIVSYDLDSNLITVSYNANDTSLAKSRTFLVTGMSTNGNVISATFVINQGGTGLPVAPIWRDYVLDLPVPGQGYINYSIDYDGTVVYTGRAYGMGQDNIHLFYNHLCKSFLSNHIDFTEGYQTIREWLGNFTITSPELGNITSVSFFEDYSYENRSMTNTMSLNNPITNEVVAGGLVPFSFFVTGASGNVSIYRGSSQITGLTISDNEQHRYFVEAEEGSTYTALGARYKTVSACEARYSLYYVNSYGGVDVIPFKGKSFKKTDTITRLNYSRSFRNNTLEFENVNYMNEIKPAWELNTHYLVDSQSSKMHELVESTCVYLYDAEEQTYTPVVMTDKKLEYKTFYNQGRKFYTYTINVEESQSKERR